jgi:FkbM family methyltransferase
MALAQHNVTQRQSKGVGMNPLLKQVWQTGLKPLIRRAGIDVHRYSAPAPPEPAEVRAFDGLRHCRDLVADGGLADFVAFCAPRCRHSSAQLFQDLFVLHSLNCKTDGYFVEFGATNGRDLSNTLLLESEYGWKGILAEPARCWHEELTENRSSIIDRRCVWNKSGATLSFTEVSKQPEYSTVAEFLDKDLHAEKRSTGQTTYRVETVSLIDLLNEHGAPHTIDYLSIDTEGSEFAILSEFDFDAYDIRIITVEHNYTENRNLLHQLLTGNGYRRTLTEL